MGLLVVGRAMVAVVRTVEYVTMVRASPVAKVIVGIGEPVFCVAIPICECWAIVGCGKIMLVGCVGLHEIAASTGVMGMRFNMRFEGVVDANADDITTALSGCLLVSVCI